MASGRYANTKKSLLVTLMILMTQVGYLENLNPWISGEESLDDAETVLETGGQGSANYSLAQSTQGEALALNAAMGPITFGYVEDADAAAIYGNGSIWTVSSSSVLSSISPQRTTANNSMFSDTEWNWNDNRSVRSQGCHYSIQHEDKDRGANPLC